MFRQAIASGAGETGARGSWRMATELVLPGDRSKDNVCRGAWLLAVRVHR